MYHVLLTNAKREFLTSETKLFSVRTATLGRDRTTNRPNVKFRREAIDKSATNRNVASSLNFLPARLARTVARHALEDYYLSDKIYSRSRPWIEPYYAIRRIDGMPRRVLFFFSAGLSPLSAIFAVYPGAGIRNTGPADTLRGNG